jgi:uncharacterized protein
VVKVDNVSFATRKQTLAGQFSVSSMVRLGGALMAEAEQGDAAFSLTGARGGLGQLRLVLKVGASLQLQCQRCLQALPFSVDATARLDIAQEGTVLEEDDLSDDSADWIEADREFDVAAAVEDELILALPVSPRHVSCEARVSEGEAMDGVGRKAGKSAAAKPPSSAQKKAAARLIMGKAAKTPGESAPSAPPKQSPFAVLAQLKGK